MTRERLQRRQKLQAERRKRKRWRRALAGLTDPVILLLEAGRVDRVPLSFLTLPKLKERIHDYNLTLELARTDAPDERGDVDSGPASKIDLACPRLMKNTAPVDLTMVEALHAQGRLTFDWLVGRGELTPGPGRRWARIDHADLMAALQSINLQWKRRRGPYLGYLIS